MSACTNCGAANAEVYCAQCGEKQPGHHDLAVGHFTHDAVHELLHLDSKLFTTLKYLVARPGFLTAEYFAGRKKRYIAPLRLFLTLFAIQFFAFTAIKPVAMFTIERIAKFDATGKLDHKLHAKAQKLHMTYEQYTERIDHRWQKNLSLMQLVYIAGLALILKLIYFRRYLVEHLVFAAHYLSFSYVFALVVIVPIYAFAGGFAPGPAQKTAGTLGVVTHLVYLYLAQRRFYAQTTGAAAGKTVLVYAGVVGMTIVVFMATMIAALAQYG